MGRLTGVWASLPARVGSARALSGAVYVDQVCGSDETFKNGPFPFGAVGTGGLFVKVPRRMENILMKAKIIQLVAVASTTMICWGGCFDGGWWPWNWVADLW